MVTTLGVPKPSPNVCSDEDQRFFSVFFITSMILLKPGVSMCYERKPESGMIGRLQ